MLFVCKKITILGCLLFALSSKNVFSAEGFGTAGVTNEDFPLCQAVRPSEVFNAQISGGCAAIRMPNLDEFKQIVQKKTHDEFTLSHINIDLLPSDFEVYFPLFNLTFNQVDPSVASPVFHIVFTKKQ